LLCAAWHGCVVAGAPATCPGHCMDSGGCGRSGVECGVECPALAAGRVVVDRRRRRRGTGPPGCCCTRRRQSAPGRQCWPHRGSLLLNRTIASRDKHLLPGHVIATRLAITARQAPESAAPGLGLAQGDSSQAECHSEMVASERASRWSPGSGGCSSRLTGRVALVSRWRVRGLVARRRAGRSVRCTSTAPRSALGCRRRTHGRSSGRRW